MIKVGTSLESDPKCSLVICNELAFKGSGALVDPLKTFVVFAMFCHSHVLFYLLILATLSKLHLLYTEAGAALLG